MKKLALFAFVAALGVLFVGCGDDKPKQEATSTEAPATEASTETTETSTEAPATEATPAPEASTEAPAEAKTEEAK